MVLWSYVKTICVVLILMTVFLVVAKTTIAQTPQQIISDLQNDIRVEISPKFPQAGDEVTIDLISYSTNLDRARMNWTYQGKTTLSGLGEKQYVTNIGPLGSKTQIIVYIQTSSGATVERVVTLQPTDIDLLWQAHSYTPPFYQGKALYPHQGLVTITAIPNNGTPMTLSQAKNYVYTWRKDGDVLGAFSGYGKNTLSMRGPVISQEFTVQVDVTDLNGQSVGRGETTITPQSPQITFYEESPRYGVLYNQALTNINVTTQELGINAVPYFFNKSPEPLDLEYSWTLNGAPIDTPEDPRRLGLRTEAKTAGSSVIGIQIQNLSKILQFAKQTLSLEYTPSSSNNSGL